MTASVDYLPIWKKNATPEERFGEMASIARKYPERFTRLCVIYEEAAAEGTILRYCSLNVDTTTLLGMLEGTKEEIHVITRGKRLPR